MDSVRSRVVNLKELNPSLTVQMLKEALKEAFSRVYGLPVGALPQSRLDEPRVRALAERNRSWQWNYGQKLPFTWERESRFPWGGVQICLQIESGVIRQAKVYSDAMEPGFVPLLEELLVGCCFEKNRLESRLCGQLGAVEPDIVAMVSCED